MYKKVGERRGGEGGSIKFRGEKRRGKGTGDTKVNERSGCWGGGGAVLKVGIGWLSNQI